MKRITFIFLVLILSFGLIGCNNTKNQKGNTNQNDSSIVTNDTTVNNSIQNSTASYTSVVNESTSKPTDKSITEKPNGANDKEFIGLEYTDLPDGITEHEGMVLKGDYCLAYVSKRKIQMVWLEKAFYNKDGKVQYYKVLDVIVSPENDEKYTFALEGNYLNGEYAPDIITLVERTDEDYWNISHAWRINLEKVQIEQIDLKGLKCENMTFND